MSREVQDLERALANKLSKKAEDILLNGQRRLLQVRNTFRKKTLPGSFRRSQLFQKSFLQWHNWEDSGVKTIF